MSVRISNSKNMACATFALSRSFRSLTPTRPALRMTGGGHLVPGNLLSLSPRRGARPPLSCFSMVRWWSLAFGIACLLLVIFLAATYTGVPLLTDPGPAMRAARPIAAFAGVLLLIADVFLPVRDPIMVANGVCSACGGTLLSWCAVGAR